LGVRRRSRAGDSGLGVAFGRGHAPKHIPYISEAVFVGKYRHGKGSSIVVADE